MLTRSKSQLHLFLFIFFAMPGAIRAGLAQDYFLPIGIIQGYEASSDYVGQVVNFRGVVTGTREDENERGAWFYTLFVQDIPGQEDGDPRTSDGIAVFLGPKRPQVSIGDIVQIQGVVTEFYGLTEIDDTSLWWSIESHGSQLPDPISLDPPQDEQEATNYFEALEGMLVALPEAIVVGPTHEACGFAVVASHNAVNHIYRRSEALEDGRIVNVLHQTDVSCMDFPNVKVGDQIRGLAGPLAYYFDRYKLVQQEPGLIRLVGSEEIGVAESLVLDEGSFSAATFNLNDYFDTKSDDYPEQEPVFDEHSLARKQERLTHTIAHVLDCPTLLGVQEVENTTLLDELANQLVKNCGFTYRPVHLDGPDPRGSDVALLANPDLVEVFDISQIQSCTEIDTSIPGLNCQENQFNLYPRPPLSIGLTIGDKSYQVIVNHFKSKRGGEAETAETREAQARYLAEYAADFIKSHQDFGLIVLGDFNDFEQSRVMQILTEDGVLVDVLALVPDGERYSYIFDGYAQLIDWILVSEELMGSVVGAQVMHINADYPASIALSEDPESLAFRSSDHDVPIIAMSLTDPVSIVNESDQDGVDDTSPEQVSKPTHDAVRQNTTPIIASPTPVEESTKEKLTSTDEPAAQDIQSSTTRAAEVQNADSLDQERKLTGAPLITLVILILGVIVWQWRRHRS